MTPHYCRYRVKKTDPWIYDWVYAPDTEGAALVALKTAAKLAKARSYEFVKEISRQDREAMCHQLYLQMEGMRELITNKITALCMLKEHDEDA